MSEKSMIYNINDIECMLVQATPQAKTIDVFINGQYRGLLNVTDIIEDILLRAL